MKLIILNSNTWQEIIGSIRKNKMRTTITVIGVLWGIFIYIVLSGASKGLDNGFEKAFKNVAKNSMFVWANRTSVPYKGYKIGRSVQLKLRDVDILKNKIPEIQYIAPRNVRGGFGGESGAIVYKQKSGSYTIYGDYPVYTKISTKNIYEGGRFINEQDIKYSRKVCVIGERTESELFEDDEKAIGSFIRIDNIYFKVVGVHKYVLGGGFENDGDIFTPFTTFRSIYNTGENVGWFSISAYDNVNVVNIEKKIKSTLKKIHNVHMDDDVAFGSFNLGEVFGRITGFAKGLNFISLVVGIATILAGVIGIGNILLISVKERTKELGIRRALGATPKEVRMLIILESVFLTLLSGVIGIILGAIVLNLLNKITENIDSPYTNPTVPIPYVIGALVIMVILGTLIGLIPAQRAVSIKPIDALREE